jgi:thiamine biosynthesis lipoprotein
VSRSATNTTRVLRRAAGLLLALVAAAPPPSPVRAEPHDSIAMRARWLMGAPCEIRAFGTERQVGPVLDRALDRIEQLEQALTTWRPDGELAQLNARCAAPGAAAAPHAVSLDLARALALARRFAERTDGAFDPSVEPLLVAWGVKSGGRVPAPEELRAARARTGWTRFEVSLAPPSVDCNAARSAFDLGAIGKGIALDEAAAVLRAAGVTRALLNFGGQVLALEPPPGRDGWIVDVAGPADRARAVRTRSLARASLAVSGNSERAIEVAGRRRGHVIDPRTGEPVDRDAELVVVAPTAAAADALSTALFVLGPGPEAEAAARAAGATFEFIPKEVSDVR